VAVEGVEEDGGSWCDADNGAGDDGDNDDDDDDDVGRSLVQYLFAGLHRLPSHKGKWLAQTQHL
jgi:hypothetical protein